MSSQPKSCLSPQEYLKFERTSDVRHEYFAGEIFAMSGASFRHNLIATNLTRELSGKLGDCTVVSSDMRVKVEAPRLYTYPDVIVVCDEPRFEDDQLDTLLNPSLIVEILSKSTAEYDRGEKFEKYRKLESLKAYVLVSQYRAHVEQFVRQADGRWLLSEATGLDATIELPTVDCRLPLAEIYAKVTFAEEVEEEW